VDDILDKIASNKWKNIKILYEHDYMYIIYGNFKEKNKIEKRIGICWYNFPQRGGRITPIILDKEIEKIFLSGLMNKAILEKDKSLRNKIEECIKFLEENEL